MVGRVDAQDQLRALLELAEARGVEVRQERLGGEGGALCKIKGKWVLFVDESSDRVTQLSSTAAALARLGDWEQIYVRPDLRALLGTNPADDSA
jgi:hypothetical protein